MILDIGGVIIRLDTEFGKGVQIPVWVFCFQGKDLGGGGQVLGKSQLLVDGIVFMYKLYRSRSSQEYLIKINWIHNGTGFSILRIFWTHGRSNSFIFVDNDIFSPSLQAYYTKSFRKWKVLCSFFYTFLVSLFHFQDREEYFIMITSSREGGRKWIRRLKTG